MTKWYLHKVAKTNECNAREFHFNEIILIPMERHIFTFSLIIEGTTEKVLQFIMPLKSIYSRNFGFIEWKLYFWTLQRVSSKKNPINWHHFWFEKNICWPFRSCLLYAYVSTTQICAVPLEKSFVSLVTFLILISVRCTAMNKSRHEMDMTIFSCLSSISSPLFSFHSLSSGLYYKCVMIVIDAPSVVSKWHSKL